MYKYSPISKILIKNFRNLGIVELNFKDSPIITLLGDNESGKTSVVKAIGVCALHASPRDQKDFIRDGTGGFGVAIELKDGSLITRLKTPQINKYEVKDGQTGDTWDTAKIAEGLPVQVKEKLGFMEEQETKEFLHIRTYENKLLFVETPLSTNYKVMYDALKVEQLTKAIKVGNTEINDLKQNIRDDGLGLHALQLSLIGVKLVDLESLTTIKNRIIKQRDMISKLANIIDFKNRMDLNKCLVEKLELLNNAKDIGISEVYTLSNLRRVLEIKDKCNGIYSLYKEADNLSEIKLDNINKVYSAIEKINKLNSNKFVNDVYAKASELSTIDIHSVGSIESLVNLRERLVYLEKLNSIFDNNSLKLIEQSTFNTVIKIDTSRDVIKKKLERNEILEKASRDAENYINQVTEYFKSLNINVMTCSKCGETIIVDKES